jgi:hypothetical protein
LPCGKTDKSKEESVTLADFTVNFFVPGTCSWLEMRNQSDAPVSSEMIQMRRGHVENHIVPALGTRLVSSITKRKIRGK